MTMIFDRNMMILQAISNLLACYWTGDEFPGERQGVAELWLKVLGEFDPQIVEASCVEWSSFQTRRPTPADIRKLCAEAQEATQARLRPPARRQLDAETVKMWNGDLAARNAASAAQQESYRKAAEWREAQARAGLPITGRTAPPQRKAPAWAAERDAARAEAKRQALGLDKLKRVPAEPTDLDAA